MVLTDLEEAKKMRMKNPNEYIAAKHNVPVSNVSGWTKKKSKIMASAGKTLASKLLSLQSRKLSCPSGSRTSRRRLRMHFDQEAEATKLRKHIMDKVRIRQLDRKAVSFKFVVRETKKRLADLEGLGIQLEHRGKPFEASRTWCWRLLTLSGVVNRARGCKRCTTPESMALSLKNFSHFIRECVLPASLKKKSHPPYSLRIQQNAFIRIWGP